MTIPPVFLELFVLALGIAILVLESFAEKQDRKIFAIVGIVGLAIVLLFLQLTAPGESGMLSYTIDWPAIFFKKVAVVTTIVVLIMSIDYADTIKRYLPGGSPQSGLGEFFALPVLTCAGMMWMASAIDFVMNRPIAAISSLEDEIEKSWKTRQHAASARQRILRRAKPNRIRTVTDVEREHLFLLGLGRPANRYAAA